MAIHSSHADYENRQQTARTKRKLKATVCAPDQDNNIELRRDNAQYIHRMLQQLRNMAKNSGEPPLVYFLEMAGVEASDLFDRLNHEIDKAKKSGNAAV